jgi:hypothetical protein
MLRLVDVSAKNDNFLDSLSKQMNVIYSFDTWVNKRIYKGTQCHVSENLNFHPTHRETHQTFVCNVNHVKKKGVLKMSVYVINLHERWCIA